MILSACLTFDFERQVLALKAELKTAQQDVRSIASIFSKVGQCPGPVKKGLDNTWCWLHCCGHAAIDTTCRKWIKRGDKFSCCGGGHWVVKKGDCLLKGKE